MNSKNELPKYWIVKYVDSQRFKDEVINYINDISDIQFWVGDSRDCYYGYDGRSKNGGTHCSANKYSFINNPVELSLDDFITLKNKKFVLPAAWYVVATENNLVEIRMSNIRFINAHVGDMCGWLNNSFYMIRKDSVIVGDWTEISSEKFLELIQGVEQQNNCLDNRVGYKFKPEFECYKSSASLIVSKKLNVKYEFTNKHNSEPCFMSGSNVYKIFEEIELLDKWFEPILNKEVKINVGSSNVELIIKKEGVIAEDKLYDIDELIELKHWWFGENVKLPSVNGDITSVKIDTLKIGCSIFTREDIIKVIGIHHNNFIK